MAEAQDASGSGTEPEAAADAGAAAEAALNSTEQAVERLAAISDAGLSPVTLPTFDDAGSEQTQRTLDLLSDVSLNVKIELGRTRMVVEDVLRLSSGAVIELDKLAGDPVDVYVNERHVARGEVLVLNDNFCVRIHEILRPAEVEPPRSA